MIQRHNWLHGQAGKKINLKHFGKKIIPQRIHLGGNKLNKFLEWIKFRENNRGLLVDHSRTCERGKKKIQDGVYNRAKFH